jgi:hypothetical protein
LTTNQTVVDRGVDSPVEVDVRFRYISIKGDWESSKAEAAFLNILATARRMQMLAQLKTGAYIAQ